MDIRKTAQIESYQKLVENKYHVFNSLFMNLPYARVENIGMLIPLLHKSCEKGLANGMSPLEILNAFFEDHTEIQSEDDRIDFFFRMVQYVERQVVLFDAVEDARFAKVHPLDYSETKRDFFDGIQSAENRKKMVDKLTDFSVRLVFTAHPTQFYSLPVLDIIDNLRSEISNNNLNEIDTLLQQLGMTSLVNKTKPTPLEEAKNIIYYLRYVYYDAIGKYYQNVKKNIIKDESFSNPDLVKIGFWPGGDRDGNPFVTAEITKQVADELRLNLMKCYYNDVKTIEKKLTFRNIEAVIGELRGRLYKSMFNADLILTYESIITPLLEIKQILINQYNSLYLNELNEIIDKVHIFKTHFATLDIRQDHSVHHRAVSAILTHYNLIDRPIEELDQDTLVDILTNTKFKSNPEDFEDPLVKDTIQNITNLKEIQTRNGECGCNRYIISNSESIYSVLYVYGLFKLCGWDDEDIKFDIVPLFETMLGMDTSRDTMIQLFENNVYRTHVKRRRNVQTIMLGFSDGTKDGGYLKANWNIYNTKEALTGTCKEYGVESIFFDGRGGPPARGGGKTHKFYASQGPDISNKEIQLTIQGQTITSTYGTKEQFIYNCEQMLTAGLSTELQDQSHAKFSPAQKELMKELSELSFNKYDALKHHDKFMAYLEHMSTLKYYGKAKIGSRPGKRGNKAKLELTDLRAISFVGSWSQLKQNVPGYFGIGTAIKALKDQGRMNEVIALFQNAPFFKALIMNSMMSLTKSYFPLTAYMKDNEEFSAFWEILNQEYLLSKQMLLEISDYDILMQEEPISRISIGIRDKIVLPLLTIQQYALQMIKTEPINQESYEKIVTRSLYGNINASRNSA